MKTDLTQQFRHARVRRWAVVAFVSLLLLVGAGSFAIQSHFYAAALQDVRTLSTEALDEVRSLTNRQAQRHVDHTDAKLRAVEQKLDAILERLPPR